MRFEMMFCSWLLVWAMFTILPAQAPDSIKCDTSKLNTVIQIANFAKIKLCLPDSSLIKEIKEFMIINCSPLSVPVLERLINDISKLKVCKSNKSSNQSTTQTHNKTSSVTIINKNKSQGITSIVKTIPDSGDCHSCSSDVIMFKSLLNTTDTSVTFKPDPSMVKKLFRQYFKSALECFDTAAGCTQQIDLIDSVILSPHNILLILEISRDTEISKMISKKMSLFWKLVHVIRNAAIKSNVKRDDIVAAIDSAFINEDIGSRLIRDAIRWLDDPSLVNDTLIAQLPELYATTSEWSRKLVEVLIECVFGDNPTKQIKTATIRKISNNIKKVNHRDSATIGVINFVALDSVALKIDTIQKGKLRKTLIDSLNTIMAAKPIDAGYGLSDYKSIFNHSYYVGDTVSTKTLNNLLKYSGPIFFLFGEIIEVKDSGLILLLTLVNSEDGLILFSTKLNLPKDLNSQNIKYLVSKYIAKLHRLFSAYELIGNSAVLQKNSYILTKDLKAMVFQDEYFQANYTGASWDGTKEIDAIQVKLVESDDVNILRTYPGLGTELSYCLSKYFKTQTSSDLSTNVLQLKIYSDTFNSENLLIKCSNRQNDLFSVQVIVDSTRLKRNRSQVYASIGEYVCSQIETYLRAAKAFKSTLNTVNHWAAIPAFFPAGMSQLVHCKQLDSKHVLPMWARVMHSIVLMAGQGFCMINALRYDNKATTKVNFVSTDKLNLYIKRKYTYFFTAIGFGLNGVTSFAIDNDLF